jgi:hypothetical protein
MMAKELVLRAVPLLCGDKRRVGRLHRKKQGSESAASTPIFLSWLRGSDSAALPMRPVLNLRHLTIWLRCNL